MKKIIVKLGLVVFLISSVAFSTQAQGFALEVTSVQEMQIDTITGDTIYSDALYGPSTIQLALDSLNSPYRVVLPDSIDKDSLKISLAPILLNKTKIENGLLVTDAAKADFASLGLPDIVYNYFLQEITHYNAGNRLRQMSAKEIELDFEKVQKQARETLYNADLLRQQRELVVKNKDLFEIFERVNNVDRLTPEEVVVFSPVCKLLSEKLELIDGELFLQIPQQISENSLGRQYLQFVLDFANLDFAVNGYPLEYRENLKNEIKYRMRKVYNNLQEYQP